MKRDAQRLQQWRLVVTDGVRQRRQQPLRPGHVRPKRAIRDPMTGETQGRAQVGAAVDALPAVTAIVRWVDRDSLAGPRSVGYDGADFVAQHERPREDGVADARFLEPVQVRATQADSCHPQQDLTGPRYCCLLGPTRTSPGPWIRAASLVVIGFVVARRRTRPPARSRRSARACAGNGAPPGVRQSNRRTG